MATFAGPERATTIQIEENAIIHRTISNNDSTGRNMQGAGGVYNLRSTSRSSTDRRSLRKRTGSFGGLSRAVSELSDGEDESGAGLRQEGDFKEKQVFRGAKLWFLAYQSIGVIYGDIGTSPLYVFSSTFASEPSYDDLVGVLSVVLWAITMMVTVKYVLIILRADNEGEGGTFSTYSLISRYARITNRDPREASLIRMERYMTGDLGKSNLKVRNIIEKSTFLRGLLKTIGVLAVSMVMADGVLTPAQSVLGAVQGILVVDPDITKATIVGTTCGILILLFLIQPFGTTKIASTFAPIVIIWLAFNAVFGIYNLVKYDYTVLKAFAPNYAFEFLIRNKTEGWKMLGGVLLAFTGVEALFADLGAFSMRAIQLSWLGYTYPCLLLAYTGQAAYISQHPGAYTNPFFNAVPDGTIYPSLIIAILAAIVASQAIITATFQLLAQIMKLSYFPQIKVVHTSKVFHGQLYVPLVNWLLMIGTVLIAAIYNNTTSLGNAYGVCVMFVTFFDTCMVSLAALVVWRINPLYVFFPWITIACLDGTFLSSALIKVPDGAWFTITLAGVLAAVFILWRFGKEQQWSAEASDRFPTTHVVSTSDDGTSHLTPEFGGGKVTPVKGFGIFFDKAGETTPIVFTQFLTKLLAAPEVVVFFHLRPLETPSVLPQDRYTVSRLHLPNCYRLVVRHGYMDEVISPNLASLIYGQVRDFIIRQDAVKRVRADELADGQVREIVPDQEKGRDDDKISTASPRKIIEDAISNKSPKKIEEGESSDDPSDERKSAALTILQDAFEHQVLYIVGKEEMRIAAGTKIWRRLLLSIFLFLRDNTRTKIAALKVPTDRTMELGFVKDV